MKKIVDTIKRSKRILIVSHKRPDGDSIGSQIGLLLGLKRLKKNVYCVNEDPVPEIFQFLNGQQFISTPPSTTKKFDLLITLDISNIERVGEKTEKFINEIIKKNENIILINIDHHDSNENFGTYNYIEKYTSSTAEIVLKLFKKLNLKLNRDISNALYTGIITDTGNFKFKNTNSDTFKFAAQLFENGAEIQKISKEVFMSRPISKVKLISRVIDRMKFIEDKVYSYIKFKDFEELKAKLEYTDGIVNELLYLKNVNFATLLIEEEKLVRISFRSKVEKYNANIFARRFEGGGHYYAAGGRSNLSLEETVKKVEKELYSL